MWTVNAYIRAHGTDVLDDWYESHEGRDRIKLWARYYTIWLYLLQQPWNGWASSSYYHPLKGKEGVGRIGFQYKRVAYRHLGFRSGEQEFTILLCGWEENWVYKPPGCIDEAVLRMKLLKADPRKAREATFRTGEPNV